MPNTRRELRFFLVAACLLTGCVTSKAPSGWLPEPYEAPVTPMGGWVEVTLVSENSRGRLLPKADFMGELIAIGSDSLHVLVGRELRTTAVDSVWRARVFYYQSNFGELSIWAFLGFMSSASHGFYSVLTAPMWLIAGTASASARSRRPMVMYTRGHNSPDVLTLEMAPFARFPQGLPNRVDRSDL